jgi:hypothetical protein
MPSHVPSKYRYTLEKAEDKTEERRSKSSVTRKVECSRAMTVLEIFLILRKSLSSSHPQKRKFL